MFRGGSPLHTAIALAIVFGFSSAVQAATYRFEGPVVFVKDRQGVVGAVFKLNRALPRAGSGRNQALATLRTDVNDRGVQTLGGNCYESVLGYPPKWGRFGNRYQLGLNILGGFTLRRSGLRYKASSAYAVVDSPGLSTDPNTEPRGRLHPKKCVSATPVPSSA